MKSDTQWVIDSMRVKTPGHRTQIGSLSGGNQQKGDYWSLATNATRNINAR